VQTAFPDWPADFLWVRGDLSTQTNGAAPASDWWDWERSGNAPASEDGKGFATRYAEAIAHARDVLRLLE
jgi:beta-glucosidase